MIELLKQLRAKMTAALNVALILLVGLLVLDVIWGVFTRYVLSQQAKWTEELARFVLVWVALLGGAVAFGTKGHLGVDYFVGKLDCQARKMVTVIGHAIVLAFAALIFVYGGGRVVADSLAMEQMTPALGWKMGYVYLALPIAGIFMLIYGVENLIETLITPAEQQHEPDDVEVLD